MEQRRSSIACTTAALAVPTTADSWSPVSEGFVGDPWLSITLTLCHILHSVSHWPVLVYLINVADLLGYDGVRP
jgi:hypothetical protein